MRIGIQFGPRSGLGIEGLLADFARAEAEGFATLWLGQVFADDALTLLALAAARTRRIELGASVVPLPTRHPLTLAQQALTVQRASAGRLVLGVGRGHPELLGRKLGLPVDRALPRTREALEVLRPLLRGEHVRYTGEFERLRAGVALEGIAAPPVLLAALGPRMLDLAAELADGVSLVYAGADFVARQVRPRLPAGARVVASLPVAVTDSPEPLRHAIDAFTGPSSSLPAYQRTLARQGVRRVSELALVGAEADVAAGLDALAAAGVTDLNPILVSSDGDPTCARRTRAWLAERACRQPTETR